MADLCAHGHVVILIEDHADTREAFTLILETVGCAVHAFAWPEDALRPVYMTPPCVIVLDHHNDLSSMTAAEFVRRCKTVPMLANVPLVLISGDARTAQRAVALGAEAWVLKPIDDEVLFGLVTELCREIRPRALG